MIDCSVYDMLVPFMFEGNSGLGRSSMTDVFLFVLPCSLRIWLCFTDVGVVFSNEELKQLMEGGLSSQPLDGSANPSPSRPEVKKAGEGDQSLLRAISMDKDPLQRFTSDGAFMSELLSAFRTEKDLDPSSKDDMGGEHEGLHDFSWFHDDSLHLSGGEGNPGTSEKRDPNGMAAQNKQGAVQLTDSVVQTMGMGQPPAHTVASVPPTAIYQQVAHPVAITANNHPGSMQIANNQQVDQGRVPEQKYITLLDGKILQTADGNAIVATLPNGQAQLTVPIPGSSSVLQYIPMLESTVAATVSNTTGRHINLPTPAMPVESPHLPSSPYESYSPNHNLCLSTTEQMMEAAAKQQQLLQQQAATRAALPRKSQSAGEASRDTSSSQRQYMKPQLRPILKPLSTSNSNPEHSNPALETLPSATSDATGEVQRKVSHKRERSLAATGLLVSDAIPAPPQSVSRMSDDPEFYEGQIAKVSPNSSLSPPNEDCKISDMKEEDIISNFDENAAKLGLTPVETNTILRHLKNRDIKLSAEILQIVDQILPPVGIKRRGRRPGQKLKDQLPGIIEPTDSDILITLLLEDPSAKTLPLEELRKMIRKEKNRIAAALSRVRSEYKMKNLERDLQELQRESSALNKWLDSTPEVKPHRLLFKNNGLESEAILLDADIKPPIRHLSL